VETQAVRAAPLAIDVFADVVCPWCFVGNERLERVVASIDLPVTVRHRPFLLNPDTPPEGTDIPAMLRRKYGVEPERLWARLEAEARKAGVELDLSKQRFSYPTVRAHTLLRHAGPKGTERALLRDLYRANFLQARNISDVGVLAEIAAPHGFAAGETARLLDDPAELAATTAETEEAAASGITGVPFFVFDQRFAVSGAQQEEVLRAAIARASSSAAD
jgi:predicted DsbA family dithiol-disulfide isomerase